MQAKGSWTFKKRVTIIVIVKSKERKRYAAICTGYGATFSKFQGFLSSPLTFHLLFFSVADFNKHNVFGMRNQPKTMFLCGMLKDEILYIVQKTILYPDAHTIERGGTHVAKKTFPYHVGEFVEFDQEEKLCTRLLNAVKVVFTKNKHGNIRVNTAYPTMCKHKISLWAFDTDQDMQLFTFSVERCHRRENGLIFLTSDQ